MANRVSHYVFTMYTIFMVDQIFRVDAVAMRARVANVLRGSDVKVVIDDSHREVQLLSSLDSIEVTLLKLERNFLYVLCSLLFFPRRENSDENYLRMRTKIFQLGVWRDIVSHNVGRVFPILIVDRDFRGVLDQTISYNGDYADVCALMRTVMEVGDIMCYLIEP